MKKIMLAIALMAFSAGAFAQKKDTITTPSGLKYVQISPGNGTAKPVKGSKLKVRYRGTLPDGIVFDSNMGDAPFKFTMDAKEVIPGWEEGFKLMTEGEKGYLIIPARLAYGKKGVQHPEDAGVYIIPPNSDLIFEVELLSFK